ESIFDYLYSGDRPADIYAAITRQLELWDWLNAPDLDDNDAIWLLRDQYIRNLMGYGGYVGGRQKSGEFQYGPFFDLRWLNDAQGELGEKCRQLVRGGRLSDALDILIEDHLGRNDPIFAKEFNVLAVYGGNDLEFVRDRQARMIEGEVSQFTSARMAELEKAADQLGKNISRHGEAVQNKVREAEVSLGDDLKAVGAKVLSDAEGEIATAVSELKHEIASAKMHKQNFSAELFADFEKHKAELDAVKEAVGGAMEIDGAHQHWAGRASAHGTAKKDAEKRFWWMLGIIGLGAVTYVGVILGVEPTSLNSVNGIPNLSATLLVFSPILFAVWALRFFQAQYMVERDSELEAQSRTTMAQTYVGLLGSGSVDDRHASFTNEQRLLILGSLFRPVSPGGVHDASPPFGLEIVSRVLSGTKNKAKPEGGG
ncbi:MAG: hypothetical protein ACPG06_10565, partial [Alphaproteobacteria bacterium]